MNSDFLKWAKTKIANFNLFELGNSVVLLNLLMFYLVPLSFLLGFSSGFTLINYQVPWRALGYVAFGIAAFAVGYFNSLARHLAKKTPNVFIGDWNLKRTRIVFWVIFLTGTVSKIIRILAGGYFVKNNLNPLFGQNVFYSLIGYLDWFYYIALAISLINYFRLKKIGDNNYRMWGWLAFSVLSLEIAYGVPSCCRITVVSPLLVYLLTKSYLSKIRYREIALTFAVVAFILFPLGNFCRNPLTLKNYHIVNPPQDNQKLINSRNINISNAGNFLIDSFLSRINQSFVFSKILDAPPELLAPYGSSLSNFLLTLGPPRFIWKNKPLSTNSLSNDFGHKLDILAPEDFTSSVGPTMIGDIFINFGIAGIIFGMLLIGMIFRFIYDYLIRLTNVSSSGLMIYSVFWIQIILGMENEIAPVWAGLIKLFAMLFAIHFFLTYKTETNKK